MSSYFNTMSECMRDPWAIVKMAFNQYDSYMDTLQDAVLKKDEDKLGDLRLTFYTLRRHLETKDCRPGALLEELHDFAHDVGNSQIRIKGGRVASDNPWLAY